MTEGLESIVYITNRASILGGAEKVACQEAIAAAQRGIDVTLFAAAGPVAPELSGAGVHVVCLGQELSSEDPNKLRGFAHGLWNLAAARELKAILSEKSPSGTVVHLHTWTHVLSASVLGVIRRLGFPLVVTAHDYFLVCPNGGLLDYQHMKKCCLQPLCHECWHRNCDKRSYPQKLYRSLRWVLQRNELAHISNISIATISDIGERLIENRAQASGLGQAKYVRVPNPIDVPTLEFRECGTVCPYPKDSFYLYVGRMSVEKGPQLFCEAAQSLQHRAILIGDGPLLASLRSTYPQCIFLGQLGFDEIVPYYANARALVVPSLWYEGLPLAVCEAKCFMRGPFITPTECAATEAAGYFDNELTFESGSAKSLQVRLESLEIDEILKAIRDKPQAPAPTMGIDAHMDTLMQLYGDVLTHD